MYEEISTWKTDIILIGLFWRIIIAKSIKRDSRYLYYHSHAIDPHNTLLYRICFKSLLLVRAGTMRWSNQKKKKNFQLYLMLHIIQYYYNVRKINESCRKKKKKEEACIFNQTLIFNITIPLRQFLYIYSRIIKNNRLFV